MKLKYHREILRLALQDLITREGLQAIEAANLGQDTLPNQLGHDEYHFDNNAFRAGWRYVRGQMRRIPAALRRGRQREAWASFGRLSHAVQDFYAHSNYVQLWLLKFPRRQKPRPTEIEPADVRILRHARLRSGRLYYPLEALSFIPGVRRLVLPWLPRDSHAAMNLDDPGQGEYFYYAYHAAIKQTRRLFLLTLYRLNRRERRLFTGNRV